MLRWNLPLAYLIISIIANNRMVCVKLRNQTQAYSILQEAMTISMLNAIYASVYIIHPENGFILNLTGASS